MVLENIEAVGTILFYFKGLCTHILIQFAQWSGTGAYQACGCPHTLVHMIITNWTQWPSIGLLLFVVFKEDMTLGERCVSRARGVYPLVDNQPFGLFHNIVICNVHKRAVQLYTRT